ncbi:MAG: Glyoxalase/bleomycin resistance protein/dioxygenase [Actinomycetia bacterium]|nr:Glyoxalase/bleomycin resistance protein/dioxygenase [Actinomycetes bacterium]
MTDVQTVSSEVEVSVDPATAFKAFTEEMDLWWIRGPINFWSDGGRVVEVRCEPGVGGRIIEILDDKSGDAVLERARITLWEPGARLGWASSLDDVQTEVRFAPVERGTRVTVEHRIPAGGKDEGGTAWSRVVPKWFGPWIARRDRVPHEQIDIARLSLGIYYARPAAAARWLAEVFGFQADDLPDGTDPLPETEHGHPWIEFRIGNAVLNVFKLDGARSGEVRTHVPWVYVDDLEAHFAHAKGNGATIVEEIHPYPGSTVYVADDLEGNRWTFSQARPTMR